MTCGGRSLDIPAAKNSQERLSAPPPPAYLLIMIAFTARPRTDRFAALILAAAMAWIWPLSTKAEEAPDIQPYRAVYSAELVETESGVGIADVGGSMVMAIERTCDGWILAQQLVLDITATNDLSVRQHIRFAAWESLDGLSYRFAARDKIGEREIGFKGSAKLESVGGAGTARFEVPEQKTVKLPAGTVFPVSHTRHLIAAGKQSKKLDSRVLFEGSTLEKPQQVTAFLGEKRLLDTATDAGSEPLASRPGWPVRMAFFPIDGTASTPQYEIEFLQLDNGVGREIVLDRGEFKLKFGLDQIEAIAPPDC
jgi:envelope integrity protein B